MHAVSNNLEIIAVLKQYAIVPRALENKVYSFTYSSSIIKYRCSVHFKYNTYSTYSYIFLSVTCNVA